MKKRSEQVLAKETRIRRGAALLAIALLAGVAWLFLPSRTDSKQRGAADPEATPATATRHTPPRKATAPVPAAVPPKERLPGPRIERIDVDKTEVCYGEENFATVRAFDASGANDRLIVRLSGSREMGFRLPFRIDKADATRTRHVMVTGGGGPPAVAAIPEVKLKDCEVPEQISIDVGLRERSPHVLLLSAEVTRAAGASSAKLEPVSYEWDFGDGTTQTTSGPEVEHSYEGRPERTRFSYYLLRVKVKDRSGRELTGSRAYGFPNFGFGAFVDENQILVHTSGGSIAGERATAGERVRLYHGYESAVRLERVRSTEVVRGENRELPSVEYSAAALLGVTDVAPGGSTETSDLSALRPTEPNRIRRLELIGRAGAMEARGTIVLTSTASAPDGASLHAMEGLPSLSELPEP